MKKQIKPIGDRIVVIPDAPEEKTASGIYIPDQAKERPQKGTVLAVGDNSTINIGDVVLYGKYSGTEMSYEGQEIILMRDSDVYAIV